LVSHDRYLVDKLTDQLFIFEGEGKVTVYNGNYADFKSEQEQKLKEEKEQLKARKVSSTKTKETDTSVNRKLSYKEQREYESLELEIEELEQKIIEKTKLLNTLIDHIEITKHAKEIEELQNTLETKSERWLELGE